MRRTWIERAAEYVFGILFATSCNRSVNTPQELTSHILTDTQTNLKINGSTEFSRKFQGVSTHE
jgi:hypothetical protein